MIKKLSKRKVGLAVLLAVFIAACFSLLTLTACGEDVGTIELDKESITLYEGADETITATTSKEGVTITWETSDKNIASVSPKGKVSAKKAGTATITASLSDKVSASCTVTVKADERTVEITGAPATVDVTQTTAATLSATVSDGTSKVEWSSSDSSIATIDSEGKVTFLKSANKSTEVTFTATVIGGSASKSVTVTVTNSYPDDYAALEQNSTKANLISDPDKWTFFIKSAHASRLEVADRYCGGKTPYYADGGVNFEFAKASTVDGDETQYEFRYQPGAKVGLKQGDVYTVTFKVTTNVAGTIHVVKGGAGRLGARKEDGKDIAAEKDKDGVDYVGEYDIEVPVGETEVTVKSCIVDDKADPLAIRPKIYTLPEEGNLLIAVSDINFTKTDHVNSIGGSEDANPDSYTLKKAVNNNNDKDASAQKYVGQWSYYIQASATKDGKDCKLSEATYDADVKTVSVTFTGFTNVNGAGSEERLYYMPKEAEGTHIKITFSISLNVDGKVTFGDGAIHDPVELTAGTAQQIELDVTVGAKAVLLTPQILGADYANVTITITNFTVTAA